MRLNTFISAPLALALLSSGQTLLAASHTVHRTAAHHAAALSEVKHHKGKKSAPGAASTKHGKRKGKRHQVADDVPPPTIERVHGSSRTNRSKAAPMLQSARANEHSKGRKATSDDFLRAAGARDTSTHAPINTAENVESTKSEVMKSAAASMKPQLDSVEQEATTPVILPALYNKHGRLIVPPPLRGSHEILVRQNVVADRDGLERVQDDDDLMRMRNQRLLVPIPVSNALDVDDRLPANRRYTRPWTAQFLATLARAHYARFHTSLQVNSAVRTVEFQQRLLRTNGNAAPAEGETASPHLTGQAIDLAKHGLSMTEIAWLRGYLLPLSQQGRIDVEEEFQQACFHISVYKKYLPAAPKREIAERSNRTAVLAAAIH
ncbi:DUF5715 family protein [Edaphobacter flagellatus]|uniref:DUF5715 family protein n=1 Tax=Edaphobacter flagellatus TaxID=1933044 RepID=UPI0021B31DCE|nr:DUF5715 family protein [Edaphobacter flagellatus]